MCLNTILSCLLEDDKNSLKIFPGQFDWSKSASGRGVVSFRKVHFIDNGIMYGLVAVNT